MSIKHNFFFITDCSDDAARADVEVAVKLAAEWHRLDVGLFHFQGVTPFSAEELSYAAAHRHFINNELRFHIGGLFTSRDVLILNAAPPKSALGRDARGNNERDDFVFGTLSNGTLFAGTINGLSLLKGSVDSLYSFTASNTGTQFRSRDVLPQLAAAIAADLGHVCVHTKAKKHDPLGAIPDFGDGLSRVVQIDNFGNAKLKLTPQDRWLLEKELADTGAGKIITLLYATDAPIGILNPRFFPGQYPVLANRNLDLFPEHRKIVDKPGAGNNLVSIDFLLHAKLFDGNEGDNVCTLSSSSQIVRDAQLGSIEDIAQFTTIRRHASQRLLFPKPRIGSGVGFIIDQGGGYAM